MASADPILKRMINRRSALRLGSQFAAALAAGSTLFPWPIAAQNRRRLVPDFDVLKHGAVGDGKTLDTAAIQRAIDAAAAVGRGARVLIRGGRRYVIGTLQLRSGIDFHLADNAELIISTQPEHYQGRAVISALDARGLRLSGTGNLEGRALEFLPQYDAANEWWLPVDWRPKMFVLTRCQDLEIRDLSFSHAPEWGLHLLGCEDVLVDRLHVRNYMNVPNCDGIDPDHCRRVEIRNCHIVCGDDAIVVKATRQDQDFGPCAQIHVKDCVLETQDAGIKIGTETTQDIHDIRFENCEIRTGSRGLCIQLRDEGNVFNIDFRRIKFVARYYSDPWWGRGEAISFTAIPRTPQTQLGTLRDVRVVDVQGRAENSVRIHGTRESRIRGVHLENVAVTLDRWTQYRGGVYDNRPTKVYPEIEAARTPGFSLRHADDIRLRHCRVAWGRNRPDYFSHALESQDVKELQLTEFTGQAAHPERFPAMRLD
jgi:hypothetical protein